MLLLLRVVAVSFFSFFFFSCRYCCLYSPCLWLGGWVGGWVMRSCFGRWVCVNGNINQGEEVDAEVFLFLF